MSADLEDLSHDELVELAEEQSTELIALRSDYEDIAGELDELKALMQAYNQQLQTIKTLLIGDDPDGLGAIDGFGDGFNIVDRLDQIEASMDGFAERFQQVPTKPAEQVDKEGRLWAIRKYLVKQAHGKKKNIYAADYKEIAGLFDGKISDSYASQLMTDAAGTYPKTAEDAKHGFEIVEKQPRNKLRVYVDQVEDRSLLRLKKD